MIDRGVAQARDGVLRRGFGAHELADDERGLARDDHAVGAALLGSEALGLVVGDLARELLVALLELRDLGAALLQETCGAVPAQERVAEGAHEQQRHERDDADRSPRDPARFTEEAAHGMCQLGRNRAGDGAWGLGERIHGLHFAAGGSLSCPWNRSVRRAAHETDAPGVVAPARSGVGEHSRAERVVALGEREGRVRVQAFQPVRIRGRGDVGATLVDGGVPRVGAQGRGVELGILGEGVLGGDDPTRGLEPVDLAHQVRARQVVGGGEGTAVLVRGRLARDRREPVDAARGDARHGARSAPDLSRHDAAVRCRVGDRGATLVSWIGGIRHRRRIHAVSQFAEPESAIQYARARWEEGETRMQRHTADSRRRDELERVVEGCLQELERRIGQVFSTLELAGQQEAAERWALPLAHELAPEAPYAWELDTVLNAAFYRYSRRATDYQMDV